MAFNRIAHGRLHNQLISSYDQSSPAAVVKWLGALQAQDYLGALWTIGLRLPDATEATVEKAVAQGKIVRSWIFRGTLHMAAPEDIRWMIGLVGPVMINRMKGRLKQLELDEATLKKAGKLMAKKLDEEGPMTRQALFDLLEQNKIATAAQRGIHILSQASFSGLICHGPRRGKEFTHTLFDAWVPSSAGITADEALHRLALRYFTGHGPATVADFAWWAGLTLTQARQALDSVKDKLNYEEIGDNTYWFTGDLPGKSGNGVFLLPGFDEYLLGYKDRSAVLEPKHSNTVVPGGNGMFMYTVVINGRVEGIWKRTIKKKTVFIELFPFRKFSAVQRKAISVAAKRYGEFLGLEVALR